MAITLTMQVVGAGAPSLGQNYRKVFGTAGGKIGRCPNNDWVLPSEYVSRHHALIRYSEGTFFIVNTSMNSIAINVPHLLLHRNRSYPLKHGDRVFIEVYEILSEIEQTEALAEIAGRPHSTNDLPQTLRNWIIRCDDDDEDLSCDVHALPGARPEDLVELGKRLETLGRAIPRLLIHGLEELLAGRYPTACEMSFYERDPTGERALDKPWEHLFARVMLSSKVMTQEALSRVLEEAIPPHLGTVSGRYYG